MTKHTGTWLDTKTNTIVTSRPEEGIQLLAPGVEPTPDELAAVEAVKASIAAPAKTPPTVTTAAEPVKAVAVGADNRPPVHRR